MQVLLIHTFAALLGMPCADQFKGPRNKPDILGVELAPRDAFQGATVGSSVRLRTHARTYARTHAHSWFGGRATPQAPVVCEFFLFENPKIERLTVGFR